MAETVLVTGGTGFVAGWCIVELLQRGYSVRATVRDLGKTESVRAAVAAAGAAGEALTFVAADLERDEGWDAAVAGCDYVLHVASPLGRGAPGDPDAFVDAARGGSLRVLRAATNAGVKRVVMTSAAAAARPLHRSNRVSDETVWTDLGDRRFDAYRRSKILAERAAWGFVAGIGKPTALTTILPSAVFGPVLTREKLGSVAIIQGLLNGKPARLPRFGFWVVDVRDLAAAHVRAMTLPEAAGERFIVAGEFMWLAEVARALRAELGHAAANVPTRSVPDAIVRVSAWFNPALRMLALDVGHRNELSAEKARRVLGFAARPARATLVDCANSLLAGGST